MSETFYQLRHTAMYKYPAEARSAYGRLTIIPRDGGGQNLFASRLTMDPWPSRESTRPDYHRNTCTYVQFNQPHTELRIQAESIVRVTRKTIDSDRLPKVAWEAAAQAVRTVLTPEGMVHVGSPAAALAIAESRLASPLIDLTDDLRKFAMNSFAPGRPLIDIVLDLARRLSSSFELTPLTRTREDGMFHALRTGRGTVKDLTHLFIGSLRSMGLAARYLTGYVFADGVGQVHSWAALWVPSGGWVHIDPSTGRLVDHRYVVLGWGRDTWDVIPLRGVVFGDKVGIRPDVQVHMEELSARTAEESAIELRTAASPGAALSG